MEGRGNRGEGRQPHRVVFTVTDLTKVIDGVRTIVVWDRDINEGQLEEAELAFQAQDNDGNVWLLGEYPEEYEDSRFKTAESTWIAGLEGAEPGVLMRTNPRVRTSSYLQRSAPKIEFQDRAKVSKTGIQTCVPVKCYDDVLLIDEWNPLEPGDAHQLKYYARGRQRAGRRRGRPRSGSAGAGQGIAAQPAALAETRAEALKLERHAYKISRNLYSKTLSAN